MSATDTITPLPGQHRVFFPIGIKLVLIITALLLLSLSSVITLVSILSTADVRRTAEYNNFTINRRAGSHAESSFKSIVDAVILYLNMTEKYAAERDIEMENNFFNRNQNIAAIWANSAFIPNTALLARSNISEENAMRYLQTIPQAPQFAQENNMFYNASPDFGIVITAVSFSYQSKKGYETANVLFIPDDLTESFGTGTNTSLLVNSAGGVILHPDIDLILNGANFSSMPIVSAIQQEGDSISRQVSFADEKGELYFAAYYRLANTDTTVITTIPDAVVFEAVRSITMQNIFLTGTVLFISIILVWFFSKTISKPVRSLAEAALKIESGEFNIELTPKGKDEIGLLTESFGKMTGALNIFGRFTNKEIAVRAMRGDIKPGGLSKNATIFFSDIRGFTEKSEKFTKAYGEDASNRIIAWLNEYFTYMVMCVEKTGGVIDKFIGDAVMAHWGTATTAGSPELDAFNAVKASLMMRSAIIKLNNKWKENGSNKPPINIGCGLNSGIVTAGQLGSNERMEYTVIGDPVNLASRTEALNKPLGTDILITEDTWNLTGDKFITEEMPSVTVKGKENPVRIFAVVNIKDAKGPQTLAQVRKLLEIAPQDISKIDINAEEKKYKIGDTD